MTSLKHLMFRF